MAEFVLNTDISTDTPTIEVTLSPDKPLRIGRHDFQLVVRDDSGNPSQPAQVTVIVVDKDAPTAILTAPSTVRFGASFKLDGSRSVDAGGGTIVEWIWTYLGQGPIR